MVQSFVRCCGGERVVSKVKPVDGLNPQLLDRVVTQQLELKTRLSAAGAKTLAQQILEQVAAKHEAVFNARTKSPPFFQIEALARALVDEREDAGSVFISRLRQKGTSPDEIYLSYLAEAARLLGKWWDEDKVSFSEVTIGTSRIYGILRAMDELYTSRKSISSKQALFVTPAGESHRLGVKMASDLFRRRGWSIDLLFEATEEEVIDRIQNANHVIIGLSSAGKHSATELAKLVLAIRIHHPDVFILISGQVLDELRETVEVMGPDAYENNFDSALEKLEEFWEPAKGSTT